MSVGDFVEEGLRLLMLDDAALTSYIDTRWLDEQLPKGTTLPAVTCQAISETPYYSHDGHSGQEVGLWQITIHATCSLICNRVRAQIERVVRQHPRGTFPNGIRFGQMVKADATNFGQDPGQAIFRWTVDLRITHQVDS